MAKDPSVELMPLSSTRFMGIDVRLASPARSARRAGLAWSYEDPFDQMEQIRDHLSFYTDRAEIEPLDG